MRAASSDDRGGPQHGNQGRGARVWGGLVQQDGAEQHQDETGGGEDLGDDPRQTGQ